MALVRNDSTATGWDAYRCLRTHESNSSITYTNTSYWQKFATNTTAIFTSLIIAKNAKITFLQGNQLLVQKSDGTVTAGLSGSESGAKIRIWVGSPTPDTAPFRVDEYGNLTSNKANITGTINATSGKIAGFQISGNGLTNSPFTNDAYVVFRNESRDSFAGIGGNVLPTSAGLRAVARFENHDTTNVWGIGANYAMLVSARGARDNRAIQFDGGCVSGFAIRNTIIDNNKTSVGLTRYDYNVIAINENECTVAFPTMQLYDDGHVIRIKRIGKGKVKIRMNACYTYSSGGSSSYGYPALVYDDNKSMGGSSARLEIASEGDAMEFVWVRDLNITIGDIKYYGTWVQYKFPRDW